ncbi:unnamed protein product [Orchesella dallaii]|uniref:Uncharacterized protein n=1 Tax=Orchesella dallaii TaxID=48710 RepID=A0ABP1RMF5_9HEXA
MYPIEIFKRSDELVKMWKIGCISRIQTVAIEYGTYVLKICPEIRRMGRVQRPIAVTIGEMRIIRNGFQIEYLSLLMDNFANAVLLITI